MLSTGLHFASESTLVVEIGMSRKTLALAARIAAGPVG
jgi:hypothetical protein